MYNIHHLWNFKLWSFIRTWEATNMWHIMDGIYTRYHTSTTELCQKTKWFCALIQTTFKKMEMMTISIIRLCTVLGSAHFLIWSQILFPTALPQHAGQDSNVSHILHILDIQDASHNPTIASVPLYSKRNGTYEILDKNQCTIKEFQQTTYICNVTVMELNYNTVSEWTVLFSPLVIIHTATFLQSYRTYTFTPIILKWHKWITILKWDLEFHSGNQED